jgi:hypothetical protein
VDWLLLAIAGLRYSRQHLFGQQILLGREGAKLDHLVLAQILYLPTLIRTVLDAMDGATLSKIEIDYSVAPKTQVPSCRKQNRNLLVWCPASSRHNFNLSSWAKRRTYAFVCSGDALAFPPSRAHTSSTYFRDTTLVDCAKSLHLMGVMNSAEPCIAIVDMAVHVDQRIGNLLGSFDFSSAIYCRCLSILCAAGVFCALREDRP